MAFSPKKRTGTCVCNLGFLCRCQACRLGKLNTNYHLKYSPRRRFWAGDLTQQRRQDKMESQSREITAHVDYADMIKRLLASTRRLDITRNSPPFRPLRQIGIL